MASNPTIIEVARLAGVSKSTVSRVLQGGAQVREETQLAVWRAVNALGYERNDVASSLRTNRTKMVMLATPDITNPFWPEVARGLQDRLEQSGYSVVLANTDWDGAREQMFLASARRNRFDAIAINPAGLSARELLLYDIPMVILGLRDDFTGVDMVGSDTYNGTLEALTHLHNLGHRRIGFLRGRHRSGRGHARSTGYTDFLRRYSLPLDPALIVETPFDLAGGRQAARTLLDRPDSPTAIFAANDILAIGAMQVAREIGLEVPSELSVIGMDDIAAATMTIPPLTTMAKAKYETGQWAASFLLDRLEGQAPREGRRRVLPCRLVVRGSTAPPVAGLAA